MNKDSPEGRPLTDAEEEAHSRRFDEDDWAVKSGSAPLCHTVGEIIDYLSTLPRDTPLIGDEDGCCWDVITPDCAATTYWTSTDMLNELREGRGGSHRFLYRTKAAVEYFGGTPIKVVLLR